MLQNTDELDEIIEANLEASNSEYTPLKSRFTEDEGILTVPFVDPNGECVLDLGRGHVKWGFYDVVGSPILKQCPRCKRENSGMYAVNGTCHACEFDINQYLAFGEEQHIVKEPVVF